jgi:hypothetical protein
LEMQDSKTLCRSRGCTLKDGSTAAQNSYSLE